jgi:hypothetical protein
VIHSLRRILAPGCLPLFTSDGLNLYFYALTAHFGHWREVHRRGWKALRWQVAPELIYGQVKKSYRRRKLARVTPVMRLGTEAALKVVLQGLGFSGRLNTAFIERAPLTVRHAIAALARRSWATSQQTSQLLAHLEWWRAYYHGCRVLTKHCEWRSRSHESEVATWRPNAIGNGRKLWQPAEPTGDGTCARCSLTPCCRFPLESCRSQRWVQCHVARKSVNGQQKKPDGASPPGEDGLIGLSTDEKSA